MFFLFRAMPPRLRRRYTSCRWMFATLVINNNKKNMANHTVVATENGITGDSVIANYNAICHAMPYFFADEFAAYASPCHFD